MARTTQIRLRNAFLQAFRPVRIKLIRAILDEWSPKLGIDGAARVISDSVEAAETLAQWTAECYRDQPYSINILEGNVEKDIDPKLQTMATISITETVPNDTVTHTFSHLHDFDRESALWVFKRAFYALIPKGIAVVTCWRTNPLHDVTQELFGSSKGGGNSESNNALEDGELGDLAEQAQFERGKIRSFKKEVNLDATEAEAMVVEFQEELRLILGSRDYGSNPIPSIDNLLKQVRDTGGMKFEAELILAMKWDLLCA